MYRPVKVSFVIIVVSFFIMSLCTNAENDSGVQFNNTVSPSIVDDKEAISTSLELQEALVDIVSKVLPAVVDIRIEKKVIKEKGKMYDFFRFFEKKPFTERDEEEPSNNLASIGSGFVISENGYIVTNSHVIEGADRITVVLDGEEYKAKVVGSDSISDIAVISLENVKSPLRHLKLENIPFEVGDLVIAVGNPFGLSGTFTFGVVSAKGRVSQQVDRNAIFKHFIQTDASINRGNSGGPLININGDVIGINTAIYASSGNLGGSIGIGFAIPVRIAASIVSDLVSKGNVDRGYIGVSIDNLDSALSEFFKRDNGVIVLWLEKGAPAYKAGLHRGDVIIKVDAKEIKDTADLIGTIASIPPKTKVIITVLRGERELKFGVVLGKRPINPSLSMENRGRSEKEGRGNKRKGNYNKEKWLGLVFGDIDKEGNRLDDSVVITNVVKNSPAYRASNPISKGDILESINSYQVSSLSNLRTVIKKLRRKNSFILWLRRGKTRFYSIIKKE